MKIVVRKVIVCQYLMLYLGLLNLNINMKFSDKYSRGTGWVWFLEKIEWNMILVPEYCFLAVHGGQLDIYDHYYLHLYLTPSSDGSAERKNGSIQERYWFGSFIHPSHRIYIGTQTFIYRMKLIEMGMNRHQYRTMSASLICMLYYYLGLMCRFYQRVLWGLMRRIEGCLIPLLICSMCV